MRWPDWTGLFPRGAGPIRLARLQTEHAPRLSLIHGGAFARPWTPGDFENFLTERAIRAEGAFLGRDALPSGFVLTRIAADEAEILSVAVLKAARGQGLGRTLLLSHLNGLAHERIQRVHLEVEEGNDPAFALYRRLGFREIGRRPGYYLKPDGTRASAITMMRALGDPPV